MEFLTVTTFTFSKLIAMNAKYIIQWFPLETIIFLIGWHYYRQPMTYQIFTKWNHWIKVCGKGTHQTFVLDAIRFSWRLLVSLNLTWTEFYNWFQSKISILSPFLIVQNLHSKSGPIADMMQRPQPAQKFWVYSEFLSFFSLYSRLLADFLSHLGKWVKLINFEAENECFCTWKVEKPQCTTFTP